MVVKAVGQFSLIRPGDRVLCALSGGSDSVCLTHRLAQLAKKQGFTLAAAHFSHGLRPESAEDERLLCQRLCDGLEIPLFCGAGDTAQYAAEHGMGLAEAARNVGVTGEIVVLLEHMIISHHGIPEYGSPKPPMFPEAEVLNWIDTLDARMNEMEGVMARVPAGAFSEKIWSLDRRLYHPRYSEDAE